MKTLPAPRQPATEARFSALQLRASLADFLTLDSYLASLGFDAAALRQS